MARAGKENLLGALPFRQTPAKVGQKESAPRVSSSLSSSKIPVLFKSRVPPELKQSQQQSPLQQVCPSSPNSKAVEDPKMPPTVSALGAAVLKPAAGLLPKSLSREPLGEVQLSTSGQRNDSNTSVGKEPSAVEFVPDVAALASILSNTGLTHHMLSTTQKPSLARRVPLRGRRLCSASIGTARGAPAANLACMSHIARSTLKDADHPQSYSLTLNTQELKALSTTFKNFDSQHRLEATKPSQSTENLGVGKCPDSGARPNAECSSSVTTTGVPLQSNLTEKKDTAGSSWKEEEFVPDPAAKASIFSNVGLSHFAFGANGKLSLAQRVPMKDVRKNPLTSGGTKGENAFSCGPCARVSSTGKFGRVSCYSTQGCKGLEKSQSSGTELTNTPGNRCLVVDCSPYGLARRIPVAGTQSLRRSPWTYGRVPTSSCPKLRRGAAQHLTETQQVMSEASVTPQITSPGAKEEGTPSSWEKVAVRLFDEEVAASVRRVPAVPVITPEMGKLQRIELLAELLQQEVNSGMGPDVAPSLEKLHKLLSARSSPALEAPQPGLPCTPLQDPRSDACKPTPGSAPTAPPEPGTTLTGQHPVCPNPSVRLVQLPSSNTGNSDQMKHRLSEVLRAPQHFLEACLNDECAFYTARVPSATQPSIQRCKEPVAKMLDALDTVHFIPISSHQSRLVEEERSLSS
nr:tastin isoform X2 [Pogona vitticeps]